MLQRLHITFESYLLDFDIWIYERIVLSVDIFKKCKICKVLCWEDTNIIEFSVVLSSLELLSERWWGCAEKVKVKVCLQTIHALKVERLSEHSAWGPLCGCIQYVTCPIAPVSAMLGMLACGVKVGGGVPERFTGWGDTENTAWVCLCNCRHLRFFYVCVKMTSILFFIFNKLL